MVWVTLGLGSNVDPVNNLSSCLDALLLQFQDMKLSSVFESAAEGIPDAPPYLNMAVGFETDMPLAELSAWLKKLEQKHGRSDQQSTVTLDADLLTFGNKQGNFSGVVLPRPQVLTAAYVLGPLSQVAAKVKHPQTKSSYSALWKVFEGDKSAIKAINFSWHGRQLSRSS